MLLNSKKRLLEEASISLDCCCCCCYFSSRLFDLFYFFFRIFRFVFFFSVSGSGQFFQGFFLFRKMQNIPLLLGKHSLGTQTAAFFISLPNMVTAGKIQSNAFIRVRLSPLNLWKFLYLYDVTYFVVKFHNWCVFGFFLIPQSAVKRVSRISSVSGSRQFSHFFPDARSARKDHQKTINLRFSLLSQKTTKLLFFRDFRMYPGWMPSIHKRK